MTDKLGDVRLDHAGGLWTSVRVVASTGSTNADLLAGGGPEGQVLVAERQTAGRGRLGRSWASLPGASLTFSVLLRPSSVPAGQRGWLPLLTGVAVAAAVRSATDVPAMLKWPNDVLVGERKLAGILAEQSPDGSAVVVGIGLNVSAQAAALPVSPTGLPATSLLAEGADIDRGPLLTEILRRLERWYLAFRSGPDPVRSGLHAEYQSLCGTLGRAVRVELPAGRVLAGTATGIDHSGRLLVTEPGGGPPVSVSAGDVIHLRLAAAHTDSELIGVAAVRVGGQIPGRDARERGDRPAGVVPAVAHLLPAGVGRDGRGELLVGPAPDHRQTG